MEKRAFRLAGNAKKTKARGPRNPNLYLSPKEPNVLKDSGARNPDLYLYLSPKEPTLLRTSTGNQTEEVQKGRFLGVQVRPDHAP